MARQSTLLSKLPRGIPLLLSCEGKLELRLPKSIKVIEVNPASDKSSESAELVDDLFEKESEAYPFGNADGNATLIGGSLAPREREHYIRFTVKRAEVSAAILEKCSWGKADGPSILVRFAGGTGLLEPGHIISDAPAVILQFEKEWQGYELALLAWMKSAFMIWYCAAYLGNVSPFLELQVRPFRIPVPRTEYSDFLREMSTLAQSVISAENNFMNDINRLKRKGTLDTEYQEKARRRHNLFGNRLGLSIDKEVFKFLSLDDKDARFIAQTLRDIEMTDFGFLDELHGQEV